MIPDTDGKTMLLRWMSAKILPERRFPNIEMVPASRFRGQCISNTVVTNFISIFLLTKFVQLRQMRKIRSKGELVFRGKVGQHIEEKRDKKDQPYTMFSAFSTEKVENGFEYQWVRFFCFGKDAKHGYSRACEWMPKVKYPFRHITES